VKKMLYHYNADEDAINNKLNEIAENIRNGEYNSQVENHIALYWKYLANTAYFNNCTDRRIPFKYLKRALKASTEAFENLKLIPLSILYLLPNGLVKGIYRLF